MDTLKVISLAGSYIWQKKAIMNFKECPRAFNFYLTQVSIPVLTKLSPWPWNFSTPASGILGTGDFAPEKIQKVRLKMAGSWYVGVCVHFHSRS